MNTVNVEKLCHMVILDQQCSTAGQRPNADPGATTAARHSCMLYNSAAMVVALRLHYFRDQTRSLHATIATCEFGSRVTNVPSLFHDTPTQKPSARCALTNPLHSRGYRPCNALVVHNKIVRSSRHALLQRLCTAMMTVRHPTPSRLPTRRTPAPRNSSCKILHLWTGSSTCLIRNGSVITVPRRRPHGHNPSHSINSSVGARTPRRSPRYSGT